MEVYGQFEQYTPWNQREFRDDVPNVENMMVRIMRNFATDHHVSAANPSSKPEDISDKHPRLVFIANVSRVLQPELHAFCAKMLKEKSSIAYKDAREATRYDTPIAYGNYLFKGVPLTWLYMVAAEWPENIHKTNDGDFFMSKVPSLQLFRDRENFRLNEHWFNRKESLCQSELFYREFLRLEKACRYDVNSTANASVVANRVYSAFMACPTLFF